MNKMREDNSALEVRNSKIIFSKCQTISTTRALLSQPSTINITNKKKLYFITIVRVIEIDREKDNLIVVVNSSEIKCYGLLCER